MVQIGSITLSAGRPVLVGVVVSPDWEEAEWLAADILEIRLDHLLAVEPTLPVADFIKRLRKESQKPVLLTIRRPEESESPQIGLSENERLAFFTELVHQVDALDIEISAPIASRVCRLARKEKKVLIGSYHNFRRLPPEKTLWERICRAKKITADLFKCACFLSNRQEAVRLLSFCGAYSNSFPLVVLGMGRYANLTRLAAPLFGSLLVYASLSKPTAPGQPAVREMEEALRRYYGA